MKFFILLSLLLTSSAFALSGKEVWEHSTMQGKVLLLNEYREFFGQNPEALGDDEKTVSLMGLLISDAWAGEFNCVYAGWPSKRVNSLCSSPARHNPDYKSSCKTNEMQCQPLLFGKGLCVPISTSEQRGMAFSNCDKKKKISTEDLIREIKKDGKEGALMELFGLADNICGSKKSVPGMCQRLIAAVDKLRHFKEAGQSHSASLDISSTTTATVTNKMVPTPDLVSVVNNINGMAKKVNNPEDCEPVSEGEAFDREEVRPGEFVYSTSRRGKDPAWDDTFVQMKGEAELRYTGFQFSNIGPNAIAGNPLDPAEMVERRWGIVNEDGSRQETYLWITDDAGSGYLSQLMETIMVIVPRKMKPSVETVGDELHMTLTTGEKVIYDKQTKIIKGGVLKEGKVDLNPDRFKRKFAPVAYEGTGISIRIDKRGEDPRLYGVNATITQGAKTCKVPVQELWTSKTDFKFADDGKLMEFLNRKCANKFALP